MVEYRLDRLTEKTKEQRIKEQGNKGTKNKRSLNVCGVAHLFNINLNPQQFRWLAAPRIGLRTRVPW
jgi:hypothetical protein